MRFSRYILFRWSQHRDRIYISKESEQPITLHKAMLDAERHTYQFGKDALARRREINRAFPNTRDPRRVKALKLSSSISTAVYGRSNFHKIKKDKDDD